MADFRTLGPNMLASPQITADNLAEAKDEGVSIVVNNRPEGESDDQTPGDQIAAAAAKLGMEYHAIPIGHGGWSDAQVEQLAQLLGRTDDKILGYCRSGTRSTLLWSLAQAKRGTPPAEIEAAATQAGYSIAPVKASIEMFAASK